MFQTFSGSSRRPRQVNMSGRNPNPFAALGNSGGSQSAALASAQQDRERRQRERDRQNAAKIIQRTWRGASYRQGVARQARQLWDTAEMERVAVHEDHEVAQLRRLLQFFDPRNSGDLARLQSFASRHMQEVGENKLETKSGPWPMLYLKLEKVTLAACERATSTKAFDERTSILLDLLSFLSVRDPERDLSHCVRYFTVVRRVTESLVMLGSSSKGEMSSQAITQQLIGSVLAATVAPLHRLTARTIECYEAFACACLTSTALTLDFYYEKVLPLLAEQINYKLLASALATVLRGPRVRDYPDLSQSSSQLSLLSLFIYFHRHAHAFQSSSSYASDPDFISVVSVLLSALTDEVDLDGLQTDNTEDDPLNQLNSQRIRVTSPFVIEQLRSLVHRESITSLLSNTERDESHSSDTLRSGARQLAIYALSLLRFFPKQADEIRMWLFQGSSNATVPAIKYLWAASRDTKVFRAISSDANTAIKLLKDQQPRSSTGYQSPTASSSGIDSIADDWRVILVFLELYTFILRVMDDDEFFSASQLTTQTDTAPSSVRDNALPLAAVKSLTIFLKNLGFTMYFRVAEFMDDSARDAPSESLSSYFRLPGRTHATGYPQEIIDMTPRAIAGIAGMTLDYLKSLVTGLLRMLYDRDSRRPFMPQDHWLSTSQLDMERFIPAVVSEEESQHSLRNEVEQDDDFDGDDAEDGSHGTRQLIGNSRVHQAQHHERLQRKQRELSHKKYMQAVLPRLEILENMPFVIPFHTRVMIFREFVFMDKFKRRNGIVDAETWRVVQHQLNPTLSQTSFANVRRGHEFEDAYHEFYHLKERLKEPIQIGFVDRFGEPEAGIDGGGVTKEFLTSVTNQAFSQSTDGINLFAENDNHLLYPNPSALEEKKEQIKAMGIPEGSPELINFRDELLEQYEFLGRVVGKCLYEGILIDINFAGFFLRKWALTGGEGAAPKESNYRASINDLRELDEALYQGLLQLKNYSGNVEDFSLDFTIADTIKLPDGGTKTITKDLRPGGSNMSVTNDNRLIYISNVAQHRLSRQPFRQTMAFLRGLSSMIQPSWLSMFNQSELQTLVGGTSSSISVSDLKDNTQYGGIYQIGDDGLLHPTIEIFWSVMENLEDHERRAVLKFVTSTPNAPLLGFGTLQPKFSIRDSGSEQNRLPSSSTCVNLLKLPRYNNAQVLKERLLYAALSGSGFDLS